jgi:hypothetical protein
MNRRRVASLVSAGVIIVASLFTTVPASAKGHLEVLLDGLASPKGIAAGDHSVFISQGWFSEPGPVLEYLLTGRERGTAREVTPPLLITDITGTPDGAGWAIVWDGANGVDLVRQATETSAPEIILDIIGYQAIDIDPDDQDGFAEESNPNSLAGLWSNDVLLADAAANDLLRVSPNGTAVTVARWPREAVPNTIPGLPATMMAEAVPTTVAIGPDGWAYVGQLIGFPGTPGTAHIWRVDPFSEDEVCSVDPAVATDGCTVWKSGFTSIFDIAFNPHNGTLYVYEIAEEGWLAFEAGFAPGGVFPPAVLLEVKGNKIHELVPGELSEPGGVAVGWDGAVFVTDGVIGIGPNPNHGRLIRIRGN